MIRRRQQRESIPDSLPTQKDKTAYRDMLDRGIRPVMVRLPEADYNNLVADAEEQLRSVSAHASFLLRAALSKKGVSLSTNPFTGTLPFKSTVKSNKEEPTV